MGLGAGGWGAGLGAWWYGILASRRSCNTSTSFKHGVASSVGYSPTALYGAHACNTRSWVPHLLCTAAGRYSAMGMTQAHTLVHTSAHT